jgi:hypothetical protein
MRLTTPKDLEEELKVLCESHSRRPDLYERLERVRLAADKIWEEQRLTWFTDHRAQSHSRRIIEHLGAVLCDLQKTSQALNPYELYILLAACYLHDIGMQDFKIDGKDPEAFSIKDYEFVRRRHPRRGAELIRFRSLERGRDRFDVGLDDDPDYTQLISLVAQGHGSDYFEESVTDLQKNPRFPGNVQIRPPDREGSAQRSGVRL